MCRLCSSERFAVGQPSAQPDEISLVRKVKRECSKWSRAPPLCKHLGDDDDFVIDDDH